tara:strand:- start:755 stop:994 length:240 start_codon:yes stop_codon:yes gene_type:complete
VGPLGGGHDHVGRNSRIAQKTVQRREPPLDQRSEFLGHLDVSPGQSAVHLNPRPLPLVVIVQGVSLRVMPSAPQNNTVR